MLVKSQVKYIQSLGHKKFRDADGVFVAEGPKIVGEFLFAANMRLVSCFGTPEWFSNNEMALAGREKLFTEITDADLSRISFHSSPNQVLAIFTKPLFSEVSYNGLELLLDTIQNPGNMGTILRTADWFGVKKVICSRDTVDLYNPKVVQSAMGSLARVEVVYTDLVEYVKSHSSKKLFASSLSGINGLEKPIASETMLLIGNESRGIDAELESLAYKKIRIPGGGATESLNAAVATGILLSQMTTT